MNNHRTNRTLIGTVLATASVLGAASCISTTSPVVQGAQGCPEYVEGATIDANLKVDANVRAFMQASSDMHAVSAKIKSQIRDACIHISTDLGATDTWSPAKDTDDEISNAQGTGACDAAQARIVAIMDSPAGKSANFALVISRGACHEDFQAESDCEARCNAKTQCDPGRVEERCEQGQLSVKCQDKCTASSYCEGSVTAEANCEGSCEAECHGACTGTCVDGAGSETQNNASCQGKCTGSCKGTCTGRCKVETTEGLACGANVSCKGQCTSSYTNPVCEGVFIPPKCTIDEGCFESCRTNVCLNAKCDPPTVKLIANTQAGDDVAKLVATINTNLPPVIASAEAWGQVVVKIGTDLVATGSVVLKSSGDLDGKSLACATAAANSANASATTVQTTTNAGLGVTKACSARAM